MGNRKEGRKWGDRWRRHPLQTASVEAQLRESKGRSVLEATHHTGASRRPEAEPGEASEEV